MLFITAVCLFFGVAITTAIVVFFFKYHRKAPNAVGISIHEDARLEALWMIVPLILAVAMFGWGAVIYVDYRHTPQNTLDVYVIAKQWMWKVQQPNGLKEINELHLPVNRDIRLILASEDVIHDFFVPAFRVKMDVVPGHYNTMWFRPAKPGRYHFFCSQYCGTNHALMGGWVTVMEPSDYAAWLSGSSGGNTNPVVADEAYIRESILQPNAKIVAGYQPLMPTFQGQLTEEQILALTAYIKSLQSQPVPEKGSGIAPPAGKR